MLFRFEVFGNVDRESLSSGKAQRAGTLTGQELQRNDSHSDEIATMDAFVALGDDGFDTLLIRQMHLIKYK